MERTQNTVSTQLLLRAVHQACAIATAVSGIVPRAFQGDPTFAELVEAKKDAKEDEGSSAQA